MEEKGIVRRIDDLGRLVVPKEIRKRLRIGIGTPIEIITNNDNQIVLKKYSVIAELGSISKEIVEALYGVLEVDCSICDTDRVIASMGTYKKIYDTKPLSQAVDNYLKDTKPYILNKATGANTIQIYDGDVSNYQSQIIVPIAPNGDVIGAVLLYSRDKTFSQIELKCAQLAGYYLRSIFE